MYQGRLFNFLVRRVRSRTDAEDLTQETFVRAWEKIRSYKPGMRFSTWLFTIGSRLASNHRRDNRRWGTGLDVEPATELEPDAPSEAREDRRRVWSLVETVLTEQQRSAVWLRYVEGLEPTEIARVLGKSSIGTRVLLFRARERLAQALTEGSCPVPSSSGSGRALEWPEPLGGAP
jgi:RNA polymerase sigma-70 factor (ECF subfamily)